MTHRQLPVCCCHYPPGASSRLIFVDSSSASGCANSLMRPSGPMMNDEVLDLAHRMTLDTAHLVSALWYHQRLWSAESITPATVESLSFDSVVPPYKYWLISVSNHSRETVDQLVWTDSLDVLSNSLSPGMPQTCWGRDQKMQTPSLSIPRKASSPHSIIIITPPNVIIVPRSCLGLFLVIVF